MRKNKIVKLILAVILVITAIFIWQNSKIEIENQSEKRAVFISYIEYKKYFDNKDESEIKTEIKNIIKQVKSYNLNMIILQVRPFSDAIYNSSIFPSSETIVSNEGEPLPFDILEYFIKESHKEKIELHAWINPYRIRNDTDTTKISEKNPAYKWLNTNHVKVIKDKGIYYNPASSEVQTLIINGIKELVENYQVDGIHMDDYFYPDDTIDLENYLEFQNTISISDFRLSNTNTLIKNIYQAIKEINPEVEFGISPEGNIENNYSENYADVKTWLQNEGYIDYIMPQIYYGFFNETKPFIQVLNEWQDLITIDIDFIPALAMYKSGTIDEYAKSGKDEWISFSDIISKQIKVLRESEKTTGFSLFRYDYLVSEENENLKNEQKLLKKLLKN